MNPIRYLPETVTAIAATSFLHCGFWMLRADGAGDRYLTPAIQSMLLFFIVQGTAFLLAMVSMAFHGDDFAKLHRMWIPVYFVVSTVVAVLYLCC